MNPEITQKLKEITVKHGKAMASELLVECAFPALEAAVKESATQIDDVVLATLEAPLKAQLLAMIEKIQA